MLGVAAHLDLETGTFIQLLSSSIAVEDAQRQPRVTALARPALGVLHQRPAHALTLGRTRHGDDGDVPVTLAVMGCVVNGPGESKAANIGISLPGTGEAPNCPVYIDGEHATTLRGTYDELAVAFQTLLDTYVEQKYPRKGAVAASAS